MRRNFLLLILSIFLLNCVGKISDSEIFFQLSDGKKIKVFLAEKEIQKNDKVLVAEYRIDERILKEENVEKHVLEIWKNLEPLADEKDLQEGLIRSKYFVGKDEKSNEPIYEDFLFAAEKIENGTWKIRKVN